MTERLGAKMRAQEAARPPPSAETAASEESSGPDISPEQLRDLAQNRPEILVAQLEEQLGADGARDLVAAMAAPDIPPEIFGAMFPAKGLKDLMNGKIKMQQIPSAPPLAS